MSSASHRVSRRALVPTMSRAALMRTAATALIAASPFVYSGASAATTSGGVQVTAPTLKTGKLAKNAQVFSIASAAAASGNFQLNAPIFQGGKIANQSLLGDFKLSAPTLQGANAFAGPRLASQPVQNLLAVPMDAQAGEATISASAFSITPMAATQTYNNSSNITVSDAETAIEIDGGTDSVIVNNSGDLIGGSGISATTSPVELNGATIMTDDSWGFPTEYTAYYYDATTGERLGSIKTADVYKNYRFVTANGNQTDATITVNNSGDVAFSGIYGIKAINPAGDSVSISNSGDLTSTGDTPNRVGIYANTQAYVYDVEFDQIVPGEYTFDSEGKLTGVISTGVADRNWLKVLTTGDQGAINIENSGTIDMGEVVVDIDNYKPGYAPVLVTEGISAIGAGDVTVVNAADGAIRVGDLSSGIRAVTGGDTVIRNDGSIEIGNAANGIVAISGPQPGIDYYTPGGNVDIVNTGDISGGLTRAEAEASGNSWAFYPGKPAAVIGIGVYSLGVTRDWYGAMAHYAEDWQHYADMYPDAGIIVPDLSAFPKVKLTKTTVRNDGNIDLEDGAIGVYVDQLYGEVRVYNGGTITVGNGESNFEGNHDFRATGIYLNNLAHGTIAHASLYAKNEEGGVIVTGDDGAGMRLQSSGGSLTVINEGSITVGNGVVGDHTYNEHGAAIYDWLFASEGIGAHTGGVGFAQTTKAENGGDITVGDMGIGINVTGFSNYLSPYIVNPYRTTAVAINSGDVTVGDNATGINIVGNNTSTKNSGTITTGDKDLSGFNINENEWSGAGAFFFGQMGYGIRARSGLLGELINDGTVETGNGTVGVYHGAYHPNHFNLVTKTTQTANGIISTGDNSIGLKTHSGVYNYTSNAGTISVGDKSVGLEASAGFTYTQIVDTIQYGGCHKLNFNNGAGCDANTVTTGYSFDWSTYTPTAPYDNLISPTYTDSTQEVAVPGAVVVKNAGIIETGDESVGVRMAGITGLDYEHGYYVSTDDGSGGRYNKRMTKTGTVNTDSYIYFYNSGTVRVGDYSTGVEIIGRGLPNGAPQLANVGTIDGSGIDSVAIKANVDTGIDTFIFNGGTIIGDILMGDGDDLLFNGQAYDQTTGAVLGTGNIIMNDNTIDFGGGTNRFMMNRGVISVAGGHDNTITGDNLTVEMNYGEIDARNDFIVYPASPAVASAMAITPFADPSWFSTLTIDGNVSGNFHFAADVDALGNSDKLIINGDVLPDSEIGVVINPVEQLKGEVEWRPITIEGTNDASLVELAGVSGLYADSFLGGEAVYDAESGDIVINATFGMGHMATAANAGAISAQNWLTGTLSSYGHRNIQAYTGRKGEGLAVWGYAFQDEGRIHPDSDLQDLSFSQISTGMQAGVQWSQDIAGGRVSVSPMFTYGTVEANLRANTSSSRGHPWAVGLNANYAMENGLYVDATYQHMKMDVDFKTPQTITGAKGDTSIHGNGFNLEAGYSHKLKSGLTVEPQLQLTHTKVDMDDFASSDGIYNLTDIDGKATTLRAGLSVYKVFETTNGAITPMASLSYINAINGKTDLASNGVDFDSDFSGSGYKAEIGLLGRYQAWDFAGKLAVSNTSATGSILQPSMTVRYGFGAAAKASSKSAAVQQLPEVTEATVKFAEAGNTAIAPMATAGTAQDGAPVVSAAYAQTGAEPVEGQEKKEGQAEQASPELNAPAAENPMDPNAEPAADEVADEVSDIVVTGSLIRRSTATEATPITVVTSEDMAERGLMTLGEVMQSFTQNEGLVQGKASNLLGRFTFGAEEINFRGLGAGRTLVLVNGRRIADYPLPFGGEQNGVDLGTIPYSAIAKVEYLSAGASATYGSDAVGGVVNIITKRDMEQTSLELTGGLYQQGFGETGRIAAITGNSFERGSFTVGVEGYYSGEILASDAKYFRKNAPFNAGMIDIMESTTTGGQSSVVPQSACAPLGFEFDTGQCTSNVSDTISLNPKVKQGSAFFDGRYDLTDRIELFGTAMGSIGKLENRSNVLFWQGVVVDIGADGVIGQNPPPDGPSDDGNAMFIQRGFSEDELGISKVTVDNNMWTAVVGAKGGIDVGAGTWYWDVALSHASFHTKQTSRNLKEEGIRNWILDGATTAVDFTGQRYTYFVDSNFYNNQLIDNIVRPVQPADIDSLVGKNVMKANSSAQSLTATLNGTFGDLGFLYKPVKFAVRAEYGRQVTEINPDERTLNTTGEGWFNIGSIEAKGKRNRWALAGEADASVLSNLDVVLGLRYDHYDDDSSITGRFTSQAKFLYRPTDWLKVRGGYGQTFRAPDMFNIYGQSSGFEIVPDFSAPGCFDGSTYVCGGYQIASTRQADPDLKEEHGDDLGLGVIVNPLPGFQFTVDWYKIHLKDLVLTESSYDILLKEWQCANDVLDETSALCADINNRVIRNEIDGIERVIVQPINQSNLTRSGIDIQASYGFESERLGAFNFNLGYSRVLKFDLTRFKGDESIDLKYGEPGAATPGNNLNFGVNWFQPLTTGKGIAAGLFVQRTGRVYNFDQSQFLEPFYDVNMSAAYQLNTRTSFRLNVNNVLNTKPQLNGSGFWPGYWAHLQTANALGRSAYVSLTHSFN